MSEAPGAVLPAERAFVVQLSTRADLGQNRPEGRVEHVVSGACAQFRTVEELLAFMARVLAHPRRPSGDVPELPAS
jgi:hypothetical protein